MLHLSAKCSLRPSVQRGLRWLDHKFMTLLPLVMRRGRVEPHVTKVSRTTAKIGGTGLMHVNAVCCTAHPHEAGRHLAREYLKDGKAATTTVEETFMQRDRYFFFSLCLSGHNARSIITATKHHAGTRWRPMLAVSRPLACSNYVSKRSIRYTETVIKRQTSRSRIEC